MTHSSKRGWLVFFKEMLSHPSKIGALAPSSKKLARMMAYQVPFPLKENSIVVELGAGTGVVTEALLNRGISPNDIVVVERSTELVNHLKQRFPDVHTIEGDASELKQLLNEIKRPVSAMVSSLPLRSLPKHTVKAISQHIDAVLNKGSTYIQFTYSFSKKPSIFSKKLECIYQKRIWRNLPSARIEVFYYR